MKYILLCICLLSLLGCGTETKTQQDSKPTTVNEQAKTDQGQVSHVMAAKQALSSGDYAKAIEEASKTIDYLSNVKILEQRAKISGKKIEEYYVDLDLSFTLDRNRI